MKNGKAFHSTLKISINHYKQTLTIDNNIADIIPPAVFI